MRKASILLIISFTVSLTLVVGGDAQGYTKTLSVRAENDHNQPGYSTQIAVYADGIRSGTLYYGENDNSWTVESLQIPEDTDTVRLVFAFDWCGGCYSPGYSVDGGDLNAYIDWLEVDGIHIEAEDFDRTGYRGTVHYDGEWASPYGVDSVYYVPSAGSNIIVMAHSPDWVEYEIPKIVLAPIDIKPGSDPNSININSRGVIPVAVLTTDEFDARDVNAGTVRFGPSGAYAEQYALEDVDDDGDLDLILHFRTRDAGIAAGDAEAVLTGETLDGLRIEGSDSVRVLERKRNKNK